MSSDSLDRYVQTLSAREAHREAAVRAFAAWQETRHMRPFVPASEDDVDVRTYLHELELQGTKRTALRQHVVALRDFYTHLHSQGELAKNPFSEFDFDRPFLTRSQMRRRPDTVSGDPQAREIARLRALNQLAEQLNRSHDIQTALDAALEALVEQMHLKTAWAFLLPAAGQTWYARQPKPAHEFALASECGLPPGLSQDDRYLLRKPPDCHCQDLLRMGQLKRAVNIVECSRLQTSAEAHGDNEGLLFHATVPVLAAGQPLGIINVATQEWQFLTSSDLELLSAVGSQVGIALERARLYDEAHSQRTRLERELRLAREVQESLIPRTLPAIAGYQVSAVWRAASEMAGDFYDVFPLSGERWGIVVADVSDKGAPAAMYMAMARSLLLTSAQGGHGPAAILMDVNAAIARHSSSDMFVTIFFAILEPEIGRLTYASAGHPAPVLRRADASLVQLKATGPLIGVLHSLHLDQGEVHMAPGDTLLAYTDGVTDAVDVQGQEYGIGRLLRTLGGMRPDSPDALAVLRADFDAHTGMAEAADDVTLLLIERVS